MPATAAAVRRATDGTAAHAVAVGGAAAALGFDHAPESVFVDADLVHATEAAGPDAAATEAALEGLVRARLAPLPASPSCPVF